MKKYYPSLRKVLAAFLLLSLTPVLVHGGEVTLSGTTDKTEALYQPGEKMLFQIQCLDDGKPASGHKLKWKRTGDDGKVEEGNAVSSEAEPLMIATSLDKPGFVRIEVWAVSDNGKPALGAKGYPIRFDGGAGVEPEKLTQGVSEPADFDAFWSAQLAKLKEVPLKFAMTEVPSDDPAFVIYDVKVDCAGGMPVSGYLTKPKDAKPKSLKANGIYMGYGIGSAKKYHFANTMMFCINAHGIENGKEPEYYKGLGLAKYGFDNGQNAKAETSYFNGMALRVLRSLEFLKAQPEWNGKDLIASGGSQGGFQSLVAAALDKDVTLCSVNVPWMCDLGGVTVGRVKGWRPDYAEGLGYYDSVNMAKRITCNTTIAAGLGDYVCPPSGTSILYNNLKGSKSLSLTQGMTHMYKPKDAQKIVLKSGASANGDTSGTELLEPVTQ